MNSPINTVRVWFASVLCAGAMTLLIAPQARAQDDAAAPPEDAPSTLTTTEAAERLGQPVPALDEGQTRVLQALVIGVKGRCQWRPDEQAEWRSAKVDDLLDPGAQVRTGVRSVLSLRVGHNATILVDRDTRLELPIITQNGAILTTRAALHRGRADFKVDHVGLTNDFEVITPTSTLAVRGTGFGVETGGLGGTRTTGVRMNAAKAIEIRYALSKAKYFVSGQGKSSNEHKDPVQNAMFETIGPPPSWTGLFDNNVIEQLAQGGYLQSSELANLRRVDNEQQGLDDVQELVDLVALENLDPDDGLPPGTLTGFELLCEFFDQLFDAYLTALDTEFDGIDETEFASLVSEIEDICDNPENFDDPFEEIRERIENFCEIITVGENVDVCVRLFTDLIDALEDVGEVPAPPSSGQ